MVITINVRNTLAGNLYSTIACVSNTISSDEIETEHLSVPTVTSPEPVSEFKESVCFPVEGRSFDCPQSRRRLSSITGLLGALYGLFATHLPHRKILKAPCFQSCGSFPTENVSWWKSRSARQQSVSDPLTYLRNSIFKGLLNADACKCSIRIALHEFFGVNFR